MCENYVRIPRRNEIETKFPEFYKNGFYVVMSSLRNFLEFVGVKVEKYPGMFGRIFAK